jgi:hypothetical protein
MPNVGSDVGTAACRADLTFAPPVASRQGQRASAATGAGALGPGTSGKRSDDVRLFGGRAGALHARRNRQRWREEPDGMEAKRWSVDIEIDEHDGKTRAVARLHTRDRADLVGVGLARLNPADRDVPEIGDELATARALSELSHRLFDAAAEDIEGMTHEPVRNLR